MGLRSRAALAALLLARGWRRQTPAAVLFAASTPQAAAWLGPSSSWKRRPSSGSRGVARDDRRGRRRLSRSLPSQASGSLPPLPSADLDHEEKNMAALDDVKTLGRARLSFADGADIDEFVATSSATNGAS
jgi:hypothetical protein